MEFGLTRNGRSVVAERKRPTFAAAYDIAVVGLGTAGAEALQKAVALGRKCLGIEKSIGMGGQGTIGGICWGPGITDRLWNYERNCARADLAYGAVAVGVWMEAGRLVGLRYLKNGIIRDVATKVVIDGSGNATVAKMCGLPVRQGRDLDGVMATCGRGETWVDRANGAYGPIYGGRPDGLAGTREEYADVVRKLGVMRHAFWKGQTRKKRMVRTSPIVNAREEQRAVTEEILTLRDALTEHKFPNPIFHSWGPEDLPVYYNDHAFETEECQNWKVVCGLPYFGYPATITYGTLVVKGIDGLLVVGKAFGVAHDLGGGLRMQGEMRKTGIAAAFAADIALADGCALRDVPYAKLEPKIRAAGLLASPSKSFVTSYNGYAFRPYTDEQAVAALRQAIVRTGEWWNSTCTNAPCVQAAYALWTAWKRALTGTAAERQAMGDRLAAEMAKGGRYVGNFAVALGVMGDARCVPVLREIVAHPGGASDPVVPNAYPNRVKAILLLGRFKDAASVPLLKAIVLDGAETFMRDLYGKGAFPGNQRCRFQALSYALMALRTILGAHPDVATARAVSAWQRTISPMREAEGVDLADRLRLVELPGA